MADSSKVFSMSFAKVYPLLLTKAVRKGRTEEEVYSVTSYLTGYTTSEIESLLHSDITYGDFFTNAPCPHPSREAYKGTICGVRIQELTDPLMRDIRILDKMVDDLAKGMNIDKVKGKLG